MAVYERSILDSSTLSAFFRAQTSENTAAGPPTGYLTILTLHEQHHDHSTYTSTVQVTAIIHTTPTSTFTGRIRASSTSTRTSSTSSTSYSLSRSSTDASTQTPVCVTADFSQGVHWPCLSLNATMMQAHKHIHVVHAGHQFKHFFIHPCIHPNASSLKEKKKKNNCTYCDNLLAYML